MRTLKITTLPSVKEQPWCDRDYIMFHACFQLLTDWVEQEDGLNHCNYIAHKEDIEKTLGVQLIWNRGDDIKSSKVSYQLSGVSISNETDWLQMARFHAEWSKKFYDVLLPYLN